MKYFERQIHRMLMSAGHPDLASLSQEERPDRMLQLFREERISREALPEVLWAIYTDTSTPMTYIDRDVWVEMFQVAGFTFNGKAAPRPDAPVRLWRGCAVGFEDGLSWTPSRSLAAMMGARFTNRGRHVKLLQADVPPERILARYGGKTEVVADVRGLELMTLVETRDVLHSADMLSFALGGVPRAEGWISTSRGRRWGRFGASGLLIVRDDEILLQLRSRAVQHRLTWGIPGGARAWQESAADAALRETREECGIRPDEVRILGEHVEHIGDWTFTTVICEPLGDIRPAASAEALEHRWVALDDVESLPLHPDFRASWPQIQKVLS